MNREEIVKWYIEESGQPEMFYPHAWQWQMQNLISQKTWYKFLIACRKSIDETIELGYTIAELQD